MKTITIKLNEIEYAKVKSYEAAGYSLTKTLVQKIDDEKFNFDVESKKKYNETFIKTLAKCGLEISPEAEDKYLFKIE